MLSIRAARPEDWDSAWEIQREAFRPSVTLEYGGWTPEQLRKCREAWDPERTSLVTLDGEVIGWFRLEHHPDHDWLDLLVIAPAHQGQGLGGQVMARLQQDASDRGVPLWLSVHRVNPARRLYRRLGFQERPRDPVRVFMVWSRGPLPGAPPR